MISKTSKVIWSGYGDREYWDSCSKYSLIGMIGKVIWIRHDVTNHLENCSNYNISLQRMAVMIGKGNDDN